MEIDRIIIVPQKNKRRYTNNSKQNVLKSAGAGFHGLKE